MLQCEYHPKCDRYCRKECRTIAIATRDDEPCLLLDAWRLQEIHFQDVRILVLEKWSAFQTLHLSVSWSRWDMLSGWIHVSLAGWQILVHLFLICKKLSMCLPWISESCSSQLFTSMSYPNHFTFFFWITFLINNIVSTCFMRNHINECYKIWAFINYFKMRLALKLVWTVFSIKMAVSHL